MTTSKPELRLWFNYREREKGSLIFELPAYHVVVDEHGCRLDAGRYGGRVIQSGGDYWSSWAPSDAVSLDRPFDLCGYERNTGREIYRFHIAPRAPAPKTASQKTALPKPLPQTVAERGLRATLVKLVEREDPQPHCRAVIRAIDSDQRPLTPLWVEARDSQGRTAESIGNAIFKGDGFPFFGLCRREPAWELTATFVREPAPEAVPDRTWECPKLPFSRMGTIINLGSRSLYLHCLQERSAPGSKAKRVILWVARKNLEEPCRVALLRINGKSAREVVKTALSMGPLPRKPVLQTKLTPDTGWNEALTFPIPQNSYSISVTIGEYLGREVKFLTAPP